jgi:hypothetical protein
MGNRLSCQEGTEDAQGSANYGFDNLFELLAFVSDQKLIARLEFEARRFISPIDC